MIREPYNLNPYNSTIDTSKVNNFSFTFSGDELGSWQVEIAKNNSSPEVLYTSDEFVPSDVGYEHIYDGDRVEGMALPSVIATNGNSDGLFRRNYTVEGYAYNSGVVKLILNDSIEISSILGGSGTTYYITTGYSLGRTASNVKVEGKNITDETIGTTINNGTYTFTGYTLTVEKNEAIRIGQKVQIEGETFVITKITEVTGSNYYQLTIEQGKEKLIVESPTTFIAAGGEKLAALDLYGKSTQAATPSSSESQPIVSVMNPSVVVRGKNLFDSITWASDIGVARGTAVRGTDGSITVTATAADAFTDFTRGIWNNLGISTIPVEEGKTYTFSWKTDATSSNNGTVYVFPNGATSGSVNTDATNKKLSYTAGSGVTCVTVRVGVRTSGKTIAYSNLQVEEGSSATDYAVYAAPTTCLLTDTLYAIPTTNSALANYTDSNNQKWIADVWDAVSGDITRYCGVINSYAGESINEPWLSTMDVYSSGTTPTTGATVVYTLSDTTTETGMANTITLAEGTNILTYTDNNNLNTSASYTYYRGGANELSYLSFDDSVDFSIYSVTDSNADYFNTLGEDLIWRLKLYEPQKAIQNFLRQGRFLQDASGRVIHGSSSYEKTYEGEVSLSVLENSGNPVNIWTHPVQIGDDLFVISNNGATAQAIITPSLNFTTSIASDFNDFVTLLTNNENYLEIDNIIYEITSAELGSDNSYITLGFQMLNGGTIPLAEKTYYNYYIEFYDGIIAENEEFEELINNTLTVSGYTVPANSFGIIVGSSAVNKIITLWHYVYSNGDVRAFYTLDKAITTTPIRNLPYRLYSSFLYSNWYFFQSRKNPDLTLTTQQGTQFPITDYNSRKLELHGTYSQASGIGVRYHTWKIDKVTSSGTTEILKTDEIYNSNFNYTYEPLDDKSSYIVTFTVVNQAGVGISISGDLTTQLNLQDIDAACTTTVNSDNHTVEVTWLNGLSAEPEEENNDFGNRIGVGTTERDVHITEQLTYSTISGGNIEIPKNEILVQTGLVINDDAKVDDNDEEFYNSDILTLGSQSNSVHFHKEGLNVRIEDGNTWFKLLDDTDGQVDAETAAKANYFIGKNYIWVEDNNNTWKEKREDNNTEDDNAEVNYIWAETQSDTNCYYYQFVIGSGIAKGNKAAYWNTTPISVNEQDITIPYNPLIDATTVGNLKVRINNGTEGSEYTTYTVNGKTSTSITTMTLTLGTAPTGTPAQIVVYDNVGTPLPITNNSFSIDTPASYNRFILGHDTNYFYFTVSNNATNTIYNETAPQNFGEKPSWNDNASMLINARFNGTLLSSRQEDVGSSIDGYQVYRRKFRILGSNDMTPIYDEENPIYTRLIGTFYLADEGLTTAAKFKFIDWTVENRGVFDYVIVPISNNASVAATIHTKKISNGIYEKVVTDWYGWSFSSFDKFPTGHYEPLERWLFKLNVETNGYSHQTNKIFHQGFNRYPKASIGVTNYITTTLSCLIGNIDKELKHSVLYRARQGYTNDTIDKIEDWEDFSSGSELVLVKDYKGRAFIGVIDGNTMSFQDVVVEILTQLSFNITQIDGIENYSIFSIEEA